MKLLEQEEASGLANPNPNPNPNPNSNPNSAVGTLDPGSRQEETGCSSDSCISMIDYFF